MLWPYPDLLQCVFYEGLWEVAEYTPIEVMMLSPDRGEVPVWHVAIELVI